MRIHQTLLANLWLKPKPFRETTTTTAFSTKVDVKGVTWTRYTAETGTVYMYAKAPCDKTVHMFFDNGITWDDALPMMENVVLK